jgi:outer membrane protein OmpA-like peptidoglycan-associated protein
LDQDFDCGVAARHGLAQASSLLFRKGMKKMRFQVVLLAGAGLMFSAAAFAQTPGAVNGFYANLGVGYNYLNSVSVQSVNTYGGQSLNIENKNVGYGSGFTFEAGPGFGFGNGFRVDVTGNFFYNESGNHGGGNEQKIGGLVNGYYDFVDLFGPGITPYIGGGVGVEGIRQNAIRYSGVFTSGPYAGDAWSITGGGDQASFAYDGLAGVKFRLASVDPNLSLYVEGRYLGTTGQRSYNAVFQTVGVRESHRVRLDDEGNESAIIGFSYEFASPPPPPPPAPPPPPPPAVQAARTYLVFFDWDRADLSARARQIVSEAAQASTKGVTKIQVNGYTDLSGTAAYNQKLSVRRAESVQAELVRDGVPQNEIAIRGYGESDPLVPTAKGVREPQNRRVEIILD